METIKIKETINTITRNGIHHIVDKNNKIKEYKPWLGDLFSFLYDRIMEKSIFPKKFDGSLNKHFKILKKEFEKVHNKKILEFAAGSGNAVEFLNNDNIYAGVDISSGLLRIAKKKFDRYKFSNAELFVVDVCDTPFQENNFDVAICNLSLNFFEDIDRFISELKRVLNEDGLFFCSVPIPENIKSQVKIRGKLYAKKELKRSFEKHGLIFKPLPYKNGVLLYFITKQYDN